MSGLRRLRDFSRCSAHVALLGHSEGSSRLLVVGCSESVSLLHGYHVHTIHGRAPAVATGVKCQNPDLKVFVITGDGDSLSIGGNHFMHLLRRNVDLTVILSTIVFMDSRRGNTALPRNKAKKTKSTPMGSLDHPFNPLSVAIGWRRDLSHAQSTSMRRH